MTMLLLLLLPLQLFALFMFLPIPEELYEFLKMFGNSQALLPLAAITSWTTLFHITVLLYSSDVRCLHCRFFIINRFFNWESLFSLNLVGLYLFLLAMSDLCGQLLLMLMESKCVNLSTVDR